MCYGNDSLKERIEQCKSVTDSLVAELRDQGDKLTLGDTTEFLYKEQVKCPYSLNLGSLEKEYPDNAWQRIKYESGNQSIILYVGVENLLTDVAALSGIKPYALIKIILDNLPPFECLVMIEEDEPFLSRLETAYRLATLDYIDAIQQDDFNIVLRHASTIPEQSIVKKRIEDVAEHILKTTNDYAKLVESKNKLQRDMAIVDKRLQDIETAIELSANLIKSKLTTNAWQPTATPCIK